MPIFYFILAHLKIWLDLLFENLVLALSRRNTNATEIIIFLHRFVSVLIEYFKELEEESIRDNFVIIYELMDEMMDFGYPQTTESKILQEWLFPKPSPRVPSLTRLQGISPKSLINWKLKFARRWQWQTRSRGGQRVLDTGRTKYSWMLLKASICW